MRLERDGGRERGRGRAGIDRRRARGILRRFLRHPAERVGDRLAETPCAGAAAIGERLVEIRDCVDAGDLHPGTRDSGEEVRIVGGEPRPKRIARRANVQLAERFGGGDGGMRRRGRDVARGRGRIGALEHVDQVERRGGVRIRKLRQRARRLDARPDVRVAQQARDLATRVRAGDRSETARAEGADARIGIDETGAKIRGRGDLFHAPERIREGGPRRTERVREARTKRGECRGRDERLDARSLAAKPVDPQRECGGFGERVVRERRAQQVHLGLRGIARGGRDHRRVVARDGRCRGQRCNTARRAHPLRTHLEVRLGRERRIQRTTRGFAEEAQRERDRAPNVRGLVGGQRQQRFHERRGVAPAGAEGLARAAETDGRRRTDARIRVREEGREAVRSHRARDLEHRDAPEVLDPGGLDRILRRARRRVRAREPPRDVFGRPLVREACRDQQREDGGGCFRSHAQSPFTSAEAVMR